jgi:L-ascorbate metabolism protein UlaG (beta-lactamase superfamily)
MNYTTNMVNEVRELRTWTVRERANLIALSEALAGLDKMLLAEGTGPSLEHLYDRIPSAVKGYVELVYDLNNRASYRLLESLLYRSPYYSRSAQTLRLSIVNEDRRPFILSTPRVDDEGSIQLNLAFDDERVDMLFEMKRSPSRLGEMLDVLGLSGRSAFLFESMATNKPPSSERPHLDQSVRWRYFGHACVLLESPYCNILTDPAISYNYHTSLRRYTYEDLPESIDYVLLTHAHQDHVLFETLLHLRDRIGTIVVPTSNDGALQDPSLKLILANTGFRNVKEVRELEEIELPGNGTITALPFFGEHCDLDVRTKMTYLVRLKSRSILFAADSTNLNPWANEIIRELVGSVDTLFIGMECDGAPMSWLYGPLFTTRPHHAVDKSRRLAASNLQSALGIVERFNCKQVYVYAMGQEPWLNHIMGLRYTPESKPIVDSDRLVELCKEKGLSAERLFATKQVVL